MTLLHDGVGFAAMQSILTGESGSVEKYLEAVRDRKAVYQDKTNLLFSVSASCPLWRESSALCLQALRPL